MPLLLSILMGSCSATPGAGHVSARAQSPVFNDVSIQGTDCWARLYEHKNFSGRMLTITGPARVANLPPRWGFSWDPRYESLAVGPGAILTLFSDPDLREGEAPFAAASIIPDVNREMGVFRRTRSLMVACVGTRTAQRERPGLQKNAENGIISGAV